MLGSALGFELGDVLVDGLELPVVVGLELGVLLGA